jgi:hypothetical protein
MSAKHKRLETEFGPDARFELRPVTAAPFRAVFEDRFERLKARLLAESLDGVWEPKLNSEVRRAANEAAALAWLTPYPLLVFPSLFEERAKATLRETAEHNGAKEGNCHLIAL